MWDKFGEFDSWEEINKAAEGQKVEGDKEALKELAKENGLEDNAEDYFDGVIDTLCNPLEAAVGKITVEDNELKTKDIMDDWTKYIINLCSENEEICLAVRKKGKSLKGCIATLLKWSFSHQQQIDKDILKAAGVGASKVTIGIPGMRTAHKLIKEYYLGGD